MQQEMDRMKDEFESKMFEREIQFREEEENKGATIASTLARMQEQRKVTHNSYSILHLYLSIYLSIYSYSFILSFYYIYLYLLSISIYPTIYHHYQSQKLETQLEQLQKRSEAQERELKETAQRSKEEREALQNTIDKLTV